MRMTRDELNRLERQGKAKGPPKPAPKAPPPPKVQQPPGVAKGGSSEGAQDRVAAEMGRLTDHIVKALQTIQKGPGISHAPPVPYEFHVHRDRSGFIEKVTATPVIAKH